MGFWQNKNVKTLMRLKNLLIVIFIPILLLPIPIAVATPAGRCAYVILVCAIFWITEALPLAVTSLVPMVLFPMWGVLPAGTVAGFYMRDTIMLFMGGLMIAIAMEAWDLHRRIALRMLLFFGSTPVWLMLGSMLVTGFLSMWISNTATTAMIYPIVEAFMKELKPYTIAKYRKLHSKKKNSIETGEADETEGEKHLEGHVNRIADGEVKDTNENPAFELEEQTKIDKKEPEDFDTAVDTEKTPDLQKPTDAVNGVDEDDIDPAEMYYNKMMKAMMIAVAYAANIGGTGTITGTPPNLELKGQLEILFPHLEISFGRWFIFGFPNMVGNLFLAWLWLAYLWCWDYQTIVAWFKSCRCNCQCCKCKRNAEENEAETKVIRDEYEKLGSMTFAEKSVLFLFASLVLLWFFRNPKFMPGWGDIFKKKYASDGMAAIFIGIILFIWPSENPINFRRKMVKPLLSWHVMVHKMPWDVLILIGGGYSIANASTKSGLSKIIATELSVIKEIDLFWIILIIGAIITTATEVMSNTATATIFLPIAAETSKG